MKDELLTSGIGDRRLGIAFPFPVHRSPFSGFVDPLYMIFAAMIVLGLALASPIVGAWLEDRLILLWHWLCLGAGIAVLAACVWFIVREHKSGD